MTRIRSAAAVLVTALVIALGGCGDNEPRLSEPAATELEAIVETIRQAAIGGDRAGAEAGLGALLQRLDALRADGQVSDAAATEIAARAEQVVAELDAIPSTTTTTTTTTTAPPPSDDEEDDDD